MPRYNVDIKTKVEHAVNGAETVFLVEIHFIF